jgi:hypothetical protein
LNTTTAEFQPSRQVLVYRSDSAECSDVYAVFAATSWIQGLKDFVVMKAF